MCNVILLSILLEHSKLASRIKREVVKVRRQLALQKGEKLLSDDELNQTVDTASEAEEKVAARESSPEPVVSV